MSFTIILSPTDTLQYQIPNIHPNAPLKWHPAPFHPLSPLIREKTKKTAKHTRNPRNWAVSASRHPSGIWPLQPPPFQALLPHISAPTNPTWWGNYVTSSLKWGHHAHHFADPLGFANFLVWHMWRETISLGDAIHEKQPHDQDDIHSIFFPPADWQKVAVHRNNCQLTLSKAHFLLGPILRIH